MRVRIGASVIALGLACYGIYGYWQVDFVGTQIDPSQTVRDMVSRFVEGHKPQGELAPSFLEQWPPELRNPSNLLPQSFKYDLEDMQLLRKIIEDCFFRSVWFPEKSLLRAVEFETWMCGKKSNGPAFFSQGSLVHPLGGSYAFRALQRGKVKEVSKYQLHLLELGLLPEFELSPQEQAVTGLMPGNLESIRLEASPVVSKDWVFVRDEKGTYQYFDRAQWDQFTSKQPLLLVPESKNCLLVAGNDCWQMNSGYVGSLRKLYLGCLTFSIVIFILVLVSFFIPRPIVRRSSP